MNFAENKKWFSLVTNVVVILNFEIILCSVALVIQTVHQKDKTLVALFNDIIFNFPNKLKSPPFYALPANEKKKQNKKSQSPSEIKKKTNNDKQKENKDKIFVWLRAGEVVEGGVIIEIQPYQRLQDIAEAYGIKIGEILSANKNIDANNIKAGQKILIPGATKVRAVKTLIPADKIDKIAGFPGMEQKSDENEGTIGETAPLKAKKEEEAIISGKKVKAGVVHTVLPGQTISLIAKAYGKKVDKILKANGLTNTSAIKVGSKILIPEAKEPVPVRCDSSRLIFLHPVTFQRIHTGETKKLILFNPAGKINKVDYNVLKSLMFDHRTGKIHDIHPKLVALLVRVGAYFGFKTIMIYSGFRAYNPKQWTRGSKHNSGRAIDFAIEGVQNRKIVDYCRKLGNVGVGYYPNSYFVHLDVREKPAFWVDYSGPGQKPRYGRLKRGKSKKGASETKASMIEDEADADAALVEIPLK